MKRSFHLILLLLLLPAWLCAQVGIGQWRGHLSYGRIEQVCQAGKLIYAASSGAIFSYDTETGETERLDKTHGLNDVGIATMTYCPSADMLAVAYTNSNIDIIHDGHTYNISDIKRSSLSGDKRINSIRFCGRRAYLACSFGIAVIDIDRMEIEDTYYIGDEGAHEKVYDVAFVGSTILAAMDRGIKTASRDERFLNISSNWTLDGRDIFRGITCLETLGDGLIAAAPRTEADVLVRMSFENGAFVLRDTVHTAGFNRMRVQGDRVWLAAPDAVVLLDDDLRAAQTYGAIDWLDDMDALDVCPLGADLWVAHSWAGLVKVDTRNISIRGYNPSSPTSDDSYSFTPYRDRMILCSGGKNTVYANSYLPATLNVFENERWSRIGAGGMGECYDILSVAVNPKNRKQMLAASWGGGIIEYEDDVAVARYESANTPELVPMSAAPNSLRTGAVCFDPKGNAWIINSQVDNALVVRRKDGTWESFYTNGMVNSKELDKILYDTVHDYIFFSGRQNRIFVSDGEGRMAWVDPNNGSKMETMTVTCMAQDHDGEIWIGTNKGLKVITNAYQAFANGGNGEKSPVTCSNITISNNEFAEYLMAYESITSIVVDGANRKWVGTLSGGLYLISDNGQQELQHFTSFNSPLFSNKIVCLGIQPNSGELFIGTPEGILSYRSTATYAGKYAQEELHVFPNPVEPDYEGPIAIRGFSRNAIVHISDAAGHVVFSGRSDGGQLVWNGRNMRGEKVASGVYHVTGSDSQGKNRMVGKILIVR